MDTFDASKPDRRQRKTVRRRIRKPNKVRATIDDDEPEEPVNGPGDERPAIP